MSENRINESIVTAGADAVVGGGRGIVGGRNPPFGVALTRVLEVLTILEGGHERFPPFNLRGGHTKFTTVLRGGGGNKFRAPYFPI